MQISKRAITRWNGDDILTPDASFVWTPGLHALGIVGFVDAEEPAYPVGE